VVISFFGVSVAVNGRSPADTANATSGNTQNNFNCFLIVILLKIIRGYFPFSVLMVLMRFNWNRPSVRNPTS
jgi:hypothetical protein